MTYKTKQSQVGNGTGETAYYTRVEFPKPDCSVITYFSGQATSPEVYLGKFGFKGDGAMFCNAQWSAMHDKIAVDTNPTETTCEFNNGECARQ